LALPLALASCGLPNPTLLLEPPVAAINVSDSKFFFTGNNAEIEFQGYEVYYRIFPSTIPFPPGSYADVEALLADSYHRLNNPAKDVPGFISLPLIFVDGLPAPSDRGEDIEVTIDFSSFLSTTNQYPKITVTGPALDGPLTTTLIEEARRSVAGVAEFKRFLQVEFQSSDITALNSDVSAELLAEILSSSTGVGIVLFAASWGIDFEQSLVVYSQPVWLGYESIVFP